MSRPVHVLLFVVAIASPAIAADASAPPTAIEPEPSFAAQPASAPDTPARPAARPRMISPQTAAMLNAVAPAYTAVATKPVPRDASGTTAAETAVTSSTSTGDQASAPAVAENASPDKPRNTIYRLPEFRVDAPKVPDFKPRHLLTPKAKLELAYKRHPGLKLFSIPLPFLNNDGIAMAMLEDEFAAERIKELQDLTSLTRLADPETHAKTKEAVYDARVRAR